MSKTPRAEKLLKDKITKTHRIIKLFYDKNEPVYSVADLLADVMHMAKADGIDFDACYNNAVTYFHNESKPEFTPLDVFNLNMTEYNIYYEDCERANKIPLTFNDWHAKK